MGGGSRGASHHGSDHDSREGEDGAVNQEGPENQHSSELHNMGVASPLTGDGGKENEVISVLHLVQVYPIDCSHSNLRWGKW